MESRPMNILVIRSATRILNQTLLSLKKEFPESKITVLAPESVQAAVEQDPLIDEVLTITDQRRMSVASYGKENILRLRERNFDLAVALYNIDHGLGYSNIDLLACASTPKEVRGYNSRGSFVKLDSAKAMRKAIMEKTTFFWLAVNYVATAFLFFIITLALIGEWGVRKLFGKKPSSLADKSYHPSSPSMREQDKAITQP
ncbi:MAG: hypothetical protein HOL15_01825 [Nitrospinaceae bacterium]|jgi:hypothetical protein|nr:hypothetical protein [Nitrospina sp.]MBT5375531.1 hypothetical protein [Nitrospinaceae bacterium]MBT6347490.1 hypothetical protein [Nitrospina sp.]